MSVTQSSLTPNASQGTFVLFDYEGTPFDEDKMTISVNGERLDTVAGLDPVFVFSLNGNQHISLLLPFTHDGPTQLRFELAGSDSDTLELDIATAEQIEDPRQYLLSWFDAAIQQVSELEASAYSGTRAFLVEERSRIQNLPDENEVAQLASIIRQNTPFTTDDAGVTRSFANAANDDDIPPITETPVEDIARCTSPWTCVIVIRDRTIEYIKKVYNDYIRDRFKVDICESTRRARRSNSGNDRSLATAIDIERIDFDERLYFSDGQELTLMVTNTYENIPPELGMHLNNTVPQIVELVDQIGDKSVEVDPRLGSAYAAMKKTSTLPVWSKETGDFDPQVSGYSMTVSGNDNIEGEIVSRQEEVSRDGVVLLFRFKDASVVTQEFTPFEFSLHHTNEYIPEINVSGSLIRDGSAQKILLPQSNRSC